MNHLRKAANLANRRAKEGMEAFEESEKTTHVLKEIALELARAAETAMKSLEAAENDIESPEIVDVEILEDEQEDKKDKSHCCKPGMIVEMLRSQGLSLRNFLIELFSNKCPEHRRYVSDFYARKGPAYIFDHWTANIPNKYMEALTLEAVKHVTRLVHSELRDSKDDPSLRFSAKTATSEKIKNFSGNFILNRMEENSPILKSILRKSLDLHNEHLAGQKGIEINLIVATVYSILLFSTSQKSNYLQTLMGLFLYSTECHKDVINVLSNSGLSVSYTTIHNAVNSLHEDAVKTIKKSIREFPCALIYDNINIANRKGDQRSNNRDSFDNGVTGTLIVNNIFAKIKNVTPLASPDIKDFLLDIKDNDHLKECAKYFLTEYLSVEHDIDMIYNRAPLDRLKPCKTEALPLPPLPVDQSTVEGNVQVLDEYRQFFGLSKEFFNILLMIIGGDQLTKNRLDAAKFLCSIDDTRFDRLEWAIPMLQLFHLQMTLCRKILKNYFGTIDSPGSLQSIIILLGVKRVNQDMGEFHAAEELLIRVYEAIKFRLWWNELCPMEEYNHDDWKYAEPKRARLGQIIHELSKEELKHAADNIIKRCFMNSKDLTEQFGNVDRNLILFFQDMTVYMEFRTAVKEGDIKRMEYMLKCINLMLQVKGTHNYAKELMQIMYAINCVWQPDEARAYFTSWVVNTMGSPNTFCPADLLQEHMNKLIKEFAFKKGGSMWDILWKLTPNIPVYNEIKSKFKEIYNVSFNSSTHSRVRMDKDLNLIDCYFSKHSILSQVPHKNNSVELSLQLLSEGAMVLMSGRFSRLCSEFEEQYSLGRSGAGHKFNYGSDMAGEGLDEDVLDLEDHDLGQPFQYFGLE
ncbi:hypothetical protein BGZ76_003463 [Entomortierella beljakovae]|nr:hypothetical protein BGZ76_003463 [Entomortierella beljakovae]